MRHSLALLTLLVAAPAVWPQPDSPHIGYVYPAGGQQGTTVQVLIGGQHLDGAFALHVSGEGVEAKIGEHMRPLNQGQFKEMQNRMGELARQKQEAGEGQWTPELEAQLAEIRDRLSTFDIRRSSVPALAETVSVAVTFSPDAEPGERELRLQTELGLTNPLRFCVGQHPEYVEESGRSVAEEESRRRGGRGRKRQAEATPDPGTTPTSREPEVQTDISLPLTINGQILPGDVDRYRLDARQGQQVVVEVSARQLIPYLSDAVPGWFQATVALLDADGAEVAYEDDFSFRPDPVLHCEIPDDGEYVIEIKDALYRGREDFVYRAAVGELPYITSIFPLGGPSGIETTVRLSGWNLPAKSLGHLAGEPGVAAVSVQADGVVSNHIPFAVDTLPECTEDEAGSSADTAQRVAFPTIVNGRIGAPGDVDAYCFEAAAGDQVLAEVRARRLGSPLDSVLKLSSADGEQLAANDDFEDRAEGLTTHHADSRLTATIPEDGPYTLYIGDAQQAGGLEHGYRLHVALQTPDFGLRIVPSSINARAGTTVPVTVHALRTDGFTDAVWLSLVGAPAGFSLSGARIPAGQDLVRLTLTVPPTAQPESISLSVEGRAEGERAPIVRAAVPADDVMQAFIYRHLVPARDLQVAVVGAPPRSSVQLAVPDGLTIPSGGTAKVLVAVSTSGRARFDQVLFELSTPPQGISIEDVVPAPGGSEIILRCDAETAEPGLEGNLIVNVFAARSAEDSGRGKEQRKKRRILLTALPAIPFEIVPG